MTCIRIEQRMASGHKRAAYLCTSDEPESTYTKVCRLAPDCSNTANHTPQPRGYSAWFDWAAKMGKTHRQLRCDGCGLLAIWVPKWALAGTAVS
jgi:hypothetical protein